MRHIPILAAAAALLAGTPLLAATVDFTGTRFNITPGGAFGGRCAPAITVSFAPGALAASGTTNLGNFSYVASHCIASPPPGSYYDGELVWTFANGTLTGIYNGTLSATDTPGVFDVAEWISFTGGTGRFAGSSGSATLAGQLEFGVFEEAPGSTATGSFTGTLTGLNVPEPATWAMLIVGFGLVGASARRRQQRRNAMPVSSF
jgi:hypothetical protein